MRAISWGMFMVAMWFVIDRDIHLNGFDVFLISFAFINLVLADLARK